MAMPTTEAHEWGDRLDPDIRKKERALHKLLQSESIDTSECSCTIRRNDMALRAVRKYLNNHKATYRIISHPTTDDLYVMIVTQALVKPRVIEKPGSPWFTVCKKDGVIRKLLEEQGVKNIKYLTALQIVYQELSYDCNVNQS